MKKTFLFLLLITSIATFSQTLETLKNDTEKMYEASYNMAFEDVINYTHPKILETVTKEQMVEALNNAFENKNYKIRLVYPKVTFTYSEIKKIDGKSLCVITYTNAMRMTFEEKLTKEKADGIMANFKSSDEYKTLKYEAERNSFFLEGKATMIAVADSETKNEWKFINYSKSQAALAKMIFGDELLKQLGF